MTPQHLPLDADTFAAPPWVAPRHDLPPGWTRKTFALALHLACIGLFALTVVLPVAGPIASGEIARDLVLLQETCAAWIDALKALSSPPR